MGESIVKLDEPKQRFDKEEARDFMDEVWRYIDKLENTVTKLEEDKQQLISLGDISHKTIKQQEELITQLKGAAYGFE